MYADGVLHLLATGGFEQVTMGAVARWMGQVPSAVKQRAGGRDGFLLMVVRRFAGRWERWATRPACGGPVVRLPEGDDEVHGVRVWSLLRAVAAGEHRAGRPLLAEIVAGTEGREQDALAAELDAVLGRQSSILEVTVLQCLADGLRARMVRPADPLDLDMAREAIAWVVDQLGAEGVCSPPD